MNVQLTPDEQARIAAQNGGVPLTRLVGRLFEAIDPDRVEMKAQAGLLEGTGEPDEAQLQAAQLELCREVGALKPLSSKIIKP